jgi:hypothetical protein
MKNKFILSALLFVTLSAFSQNTYWKQVSSPDVSTFTKGQELFPGLFKPSVYKLFSLNENTFKALLKQSPLESLTPVEQSNFIVTVPVADGSIEKFRVTESPVMQPGLQTKYPDIRTYLGKGTTDPSSVIRFDFSPQGFHAMIISPTRNTVYINPITTAEGLYVVFDRSNIAQEKQVFDCKLDMILNSPVQGVEKSLTASDNKLRTYRFAVATGGEFSQLFLNGTEKTDVQRKAKVLAALVTDLNRTNIIFEADFGVRLSYVNSEDAIIFLNGATDPFLSSASGYSSGQWNTQAQKAIRQYIGNANYDVGHLLMGYSTGGNAGCIGCVCNTSNKGMGVTGFTTDLTSDPFIVDFWDHEIGHQFGANHTFDFSNEGTIAQMEPGSGSTIMGYAGTTGSYDVQAHSDPYFHAISIQQIDQYIATETGNTCGTLTTINSKAPVANARNDYTIPKSTPFTLTAAAYKDAIDSVTYCWEQFDDYTPGTSRRIPKATSTGGPVFRSFNPSVSRQRTFPSLSSILDGTNGNKWEVLPSVNRTLNFRLTVRDNHAGGGRTANDDMVVDVDGTSGPFTVTTPNTNVTWQAGTTHVVKWKVNNTDVAPVNCTKVKILLSLNGGQTFDSVLVNSTINDGAAQITLPAGISSTKARIKVASIGNIFFDISNANFTITPSSPFAAKASDAAAVALSDIKVQPNPAKGFTNVIFNAPSDNCSLILTNSEGRSVYNKTLNAVYKGRIEKISLAGLSPGTYFLRIITDKDTQTQKIIVE